MHQIKYLRPVLNPRLEVAPKRYQIRDRDSRKPKNGTESETETHANPKTVLNPRPGPLEPRFLDGTGIPADLWYASRGEGGVCPLSTQ